MRESTIEDYLVRRVKALGGEVRKVAWVGRVGAPDRVVMLPIRMSNKPNELYAVTTIWIELKAPGKKPRRTQINEHERMRAMGQHVEVVDSLLGVDRLFGSAHAAV